MPRSMTSRPGRNAEAARLSADPVAAARAASLRYINDEDPGISRRRVGTGFSYGSAEGAVIRDAAQLRRIRSLAVPPAWTDVWICADTNGHLQATGRDARGRKQYSYHPRWRTIRDASKYDRMLDFAAVLPRIRERVGDDLRKHGLPRDKVLATVVGLLEATAIRVGNAEYARTNRSYGLTTLRTRHVTVEGSRIRFDFRGKSGKRHSVGLADRRLARIVRQCQDLPGQHLFQYLDEDGERQHIESANVNDYIRNAAGGDFTAKDFRTWLGTVGAAEALLEMAASDDVPPPKQAIVRAVEDVSAMLGNTPAVCRRCYVHPAILDAYLEGTTIVVDTAAAGEDGLRPEEAAVLALLKRHGAPVRTAATATAGAA